MASNNGNLQHLQTMQNGDELHSQKNQASTCFANFQTHVLLTFVWPPFSTDPCRQLGAKLITRDAHASSQGCIKLAPITKVWKAQGFPCSLATCRAQCTRKSSPGRRWPGPPWWRAGLGPQMRSALRAPPGWRRLGPGLADANKLYGCTCRFCRSWISVRPSFLLLAYRTNHMYR